MATKVTIRTNSMFVREGRVHSIVALEYMAQTIAAFAGMIRRDQGEEPRIGYVIGVPEMTLDVPFFQVGDVLSVSAEHLWGDDSLGRFGCEILHDQQSVAKATLSVYTGDIKS